MTGNDYAELVLSNLELLLLSSALNEVRNGIDVSDFHARLGGTEEEVAQLHKELRAVLKQLAPF